MTKVSTTGIQRLDMALMDGVPEGYSILVAGAIGSGMELFAKQFAGAAPKEENVIYFTTTENSEEVKTIMKNYSWREDIQIISIATDYYEKVLSKELEANKLKKEGFNLLDITKLTKEEKSEQLNFLETLTYEISKLKNKYRIIIDSLDFFLEHYSDVDVIAALRTIQTHVHYTKGIALFTLSKDIYEKRIENTISAIADCLIELEVISKDMQFENRLIIRKVKNQPQKMTTLIYTINEKGITPERITRIF